jgi:hypothetical protein
VPGSTSVVAAGVASFVIATTAVSCGGGGSADRTSEGRPQNPPHSKPGQPPTRTSSPLQRRDVPPAGVDAQIRFAGTGDGGCPKARGPAITYSRKPLRVRQENVAAENRPETGDLFEICVVNFLSKDSVSVGVTAPTGAVEQLRAPFPGDPASPRVIDYELLPGKPLGTYHVDGRLGSFHATNTFVLSAPSAPGMRAVKSEGKAGTKFRFVLVGLRPEFQALLNIYRPTPKGTAYDLHTYTTTLFVRTDSHGAAVATLQTARDDPQTCYVIKPNFADDVSDNVFCVFGRS